ncbi:hypothetical protein JCM10212_007120 [Sporobolomyces blumeae]
MPSVSSGDTILAICVPPVSPDEARHVLTQLTTSSPRAKDDSTLTASTYEHRDPHLVPWSIRNKYYTAQVQFRIATDNGDPASAKVRDGDDPEPAVVVLASSTSDPPTPLEGILERLEASESEFDVSLLVTIPRPRTSLNAAPERGPQSSPALSDAVAPSEDLPVNEDAWDEIALSHGFEWIDLSRLDETVEPEHDRARDDREGAQRVRDALEAHMWAGMERVRGEPTRSVGTDDEEDMGGEEEDTVRARGGARRIRQDDLGGGQGSDDDDDDEYSSMGAPPLPEPRPFVPTKMEFPSTFLPSISRKDTRGTSTIPRSGPGSGDSRPGSTSSAERQPATVARDSTPSFDDDFAPFVRASSTSFDAFSPGSDDGRETFRDSKDGPDGLDERGERDLDSLEALFDKIRFVRERGLLDADDDRDDRDGPLVGGASERGADEATRLERRRDQAEQILREVFGSGI